MNEQTWRVSVWDGFTTSTFYRKGTYGYVSASVQHYPPGYIVSVS